MKIADHAYVQNGFRAVNEDGWVPCARCGHSQGVHAMRAVIIEPTTTPGNPMRCSNQRCRLVYAHSGPCCCDPGCRHG